MVPRWGSAACSSALLLALSGLLAFSASAQTYEAVRRGEIESLPHEMTPEEMQIRDQIGRDQTPTPPPSARPVRNLAEFERMKGVLVRYPLGISVALVAEMSQDALVYCVVTAAQQSTAYNAFAAGGVTMSHVVFFNHATDSYWTRDYGPWFIFDANDDLAIIDTIYNRPRPDDDTVPTDFATFLGIPSYIPDINHTGGNYMCDSDERAISTTLVYEENTDKTVAQINAIMNDYLGITTYHCYPDVNGDYIEHIDCWGKYLGVDKILIRQVPVGHSQYDEIEAAVDYFESQVSAYGTPYRIYRVSTPGNEPYTNSLILNEKVLVPIMGGSHPDAAALAAYQAAMPGYEVLGFTGSWESTDALHCRAIGIGDPAQLYVYAIPLRDTADDAHPYRVNGVIVDHSETGLVPGSARVYWRAGTSGPFTSVALNSIAGTDSFYANIPAQPLGTTVQYYLHAADNSGRDEDWPFMGAADPFTFHVQPDLVAPVIAETTDLPFTDDTAGPYLVQSRVTDNMAVASVTLRYRVNGGEFAALPMAAINGSLYAAGIPGQPIPSHVEYYIEAGDFGGNTALDPASAPASLYDFFVLPRANLLATDLEGGSSWTHAAVTSGFADQWHLSTRRNHTPNGTTSWKCGDTGTAAYTTHLDAGLVTESFPLATSSTLSFWQYVQAETSSTYQGQAYDGGRVELNTGAGWVAITPEGGYPYIVRGANGPFPAGTPIFSGHRGWHKVTFALPGEEGTAQVRFRFGSDTAVGDEGWYVDDIVVDGFALDVQALPGEIAAQEQDLRLVCEPNPVHAGAAFRFALPAAADVRLEIFDPSGRLIRLFAIEGVTAGEHVIAWDGRDQARRPVGSGLYLSRLKTGSGDAVRRILKVD